ncbi:MAG: lipid A biosynthesis acyltransferase [Gammaproteobacteria bacterium]|nr:lipid A biosynthesis acyltransferase [Gammaproteobacteria bacterium]
MSNLIRFSHPRYWPTWLGYGVLRIIVRLPHRLRVAVGAGLGRIAYVLAGSRRHIVEVNLALCFPEKSVEEREKLARETFRSGGISIIETAIAWLLGGDVDDRSVLEGIEHLQAAEAKGKGVILLARSMSTLDLAGSVLEPHRYVRCHVSEEPERAHGTHHDDRARASVSSSDRAQRHSPGDSQPRGWTYRLVRTRPGLWRRNSVFVPFFGVSAATTTALARIARMTGAPVVPFSHFRLDGGMRYRVVLFEALEGFPSDSVQDDARRINAFVESSIKSAPEQYWWFHRRFKTRPEGEPGVYD